MEKYVIIWLLLGVISSCWALRDSMEYKPITVGTILVYILKIVEGPLALVNQIYFSSSKILKLPIYKSEQYKKLEEQRNNKCV